MSFRNRCVVAGAEGLINLTIPLKGGRNQRTLVREVVIDNSERWQANHWKTLVSVYRKSPFFEFYEADLHTLFDVRHDLLTDWNVACFEWICDKLSLDVRWEMSGQYVEEYPADKYIDWRNLLKPSTINREFPIFPRYAQVFEERTGFIPHLSILDYLFCAGNKLRPGSVLT